ncbi:glycosyltransferase family 4 protein [Sphingomonas koreensis]|nr:glycosyltransferase family 4 protein [Sphingomonas koreensis]
MKVLLLAGGGSIHTTRWANALSQAGVSVVLATQQPVTLPLDAGIKTYRLPFSGRAGYFLNTFALRRIWDAEQPDVVNAHYASGYGTTARLSGCRPFLLSVWGSDVYHFPNKSGLHRWWLRGNLAAATRVASTSVAMAAETRRVAPDLNEIAITPFGVDTELFVPQEKQSAAENAIVIGTVKTLAPVYGIDILIESFALLKEGLSSEAPRLAEKLRLRIVGDGPQKSMLEDLVDRRGLWAITRFVPKVAHAEVPGELAKLDIYAALSRGESFGVAVLEAGACQLPVVVSDVGGLPEVVIDGQTGLIVPGENPRSAADALKRLVLDSDLRCALGDAARDHVEKHYSWHGNVARMIEIFKELKFASSASTIHGNLA